MTYVTFSRFFSVKTLIRVAFAALSLSAGVANAQSSNHAAKTYSSDDFNLVRGGGG